MRVSMNGSGEGESARIAARRAISKFRKSGTLAIFAGCNAAITRADCDARSKVSTQGL